MLSVLRGVRSLLAVLLIGLYFLLMSPVLRLLVIPGIWIFPRQHFLLISLFMKAMSAGILGGLRVGGARIRRLGRLPTAEPVLIVSNHQSLTDIPQIVLLCHPRVPAFVARRRYERFIPLVSACIRLLGSPIVDPRRDPQGAVEAIRQGARALPHGMIIFPEGHRSRDGRILPFRTAGLETILSERPMPVYLVLNDGAWHVARLADLLFRVHLIDAHCEVIGRFDPPRDPEQRAAFLARLRQTLIDRLAERRARTPAA